ncbi:hypothetical protein B1756_14060 [Natrarchaeobaculum aegyptiacum]|uniref:Ubiquitin-like domain-containing protein n=2 Tax=Natrarchaeobaculum aegyptiacum TaxID=745377 RepID=A0A2Z2I245_9EURY|nr:hypothetical protein B1756_14060 [Natrarchaeobaculum aegyptiacum]
MDCRTTMDWLRMAEFPLLVRFRTDDYPTLVPVDSEDTVAEAANKITRVVDSRAHIDHDRSFDVIHNGKVVEDSKIVGETFDPTAYIEIQYEGEDIPDGFGESHPAWNDQSMLEKHPEHLKPE